ncbi:MAG TPA: DnaJ domain-containing protein [Candidatus Polarisedimenticolia bacterium]|nr:DnaJ domain-containing protein [Candidatus Polarisedimenticolia bacterium]
MPTPHSDSQGFYRLLGLDATATEEQIQLAYEALAEKPDQARGCTLGALSRAYSVLMDPASRRLYDRRQARQPQRPRRRVSLKLDDKRLLAACIVLLLGILVFVWVPLYGSWFRSFSAGDRLVERNGSAFGLVVKTEDSHQFPGGATAPAYLVELSTTGEMRWYPASDLQAICRRAK